MNFDEAFDRLLDPAHEGGYSNDQDDPGGETMYGITERVARRHGYQGAMRALPREFAKQIAKAEYWDAVRADELPEPVRFDVFDAAYNSGPPQAAMFLQQALGVTTDGKLGPITLTAAQNMDGFRLLARFNGRRLAFLTDRGTWSTFGKGWARRIAANLKEA